MSAMRWLVYFLPFFLLAQTITNGFPNPSARCSKDSKSWDAFASLIVWTAGESGTDCWAEVIVNDGANNSNTLETIDFGWNPGVRAGLAYEIERDQWDTKFYYTWYYTRGKDSVQSGFGTVHSTFMGNFYLDNPNGEGI